MILEQLSTADLILVGLGEDFNDNKRLQQCPEYLQGKAVLLERELHHLLPAWEEYCAGKLENMVTPALQKLKDMLGEKNYFVVTTSTDGRVAGVEWRKDRFVAPCGSNSFKQCCKDQLHALAPVSEEDREKLSALFEELYQGGSIRQPEEAFLGVCPACGASYVLNTVYAPSYNETGYLEQWSLYTKWLQGTVNKKLVLLELGVGLQYPSVIRWPFEKVSFYNQKSVLIRVNEKLPQLPENLEGRGKSISQNAVEWLNNL